VLWGQRERARRTHSLYILILYFGENPPIYFSPEKTFTAENMFSLESIRELTHVRDRTTTERERGR